MELNKFILAVIALKPEKSVGAEHHFMPKIRKNRIKSRLPWQE